MCVWVGYVVWVAAKHAHDLALTLLTNPPQCIGNGAEGTQSASAVGGVVATQTAGKPFLVSRARLVRLAENYSKLVWFKQGFKGAVSKVGRAFNSR